MIPGSEKYYVDSAFGMRGLSRIFAADYRAGEHVLTAFLGRRAGPAEASESASAAAADLAGAGGRPVRPPPGAATVPGASVTELYGMYEVIFARGPLVAGIHGAQSLPDALELARGLFDSLEQGGL
jgi:hypothetical protein